MFPRNVLAASAMGAAMTVSAAKAGSFGNPDQPAEGASGTSRLQKRKRAWRGGRSSARAAVEIKRQFSGPPPGAAYL
jgi:hypothetical protein